MPAIKLFRKGKIVYYKKCKILMNIKLLDFLTVSLCIHTSSISFILIIYMYMCGCVTFFEQFFKTAFLSCVKNFENLKYFKCHQSQLKISRLMYFKFVV